MTERQLAAKIRDGLSTDVHEMGVENLVATGPFDLNMARRGRERWVELKVVKNGRIEVRHAQVNWATKRVRAGMGNLFLVAGNASTGMFEVWRGCTVVAMAMAARKDPSGWRCRVDKDSMTFEPRAPEWMCATVCALERIIFEN